MIRMILASIAAGAAIGYFFEPAFLIEHQGRLIDILICVVMVAIGYEFGRGDNPFRDIRALGWKVFVIPIMITLGTLLVGGLSGLIVGISFKDAMAVSAGFGWYSLNAVLLSDYSKELSAISFLSNMVRETIGIILIPVVARYIGYVEAVAVPGISAMDLCLPIIEQSTNKNIIIYAILSGTLMCVLVPILTPLIIRL